MDPGYIKFIKPKHPTLIKWIKGYYVHTASEVDFYAKITFYQNITTTISTYRDTVTSSAGRLRQQRFKANQGFTVLLAGLVDKYQEVEFYGPLDRLAIVFYPCGLNQFIRNPLGNYLEKHYSHFDYFKEPFKSFLPKVYKEPFLEAKRDQLDAFFLHHFQLLDAPELMKAVDQLVTSNAPIKVSDLAAQLQISRRTLLRQFKKHLGYSIKEYMSVIKFRKALLKYQSSKGQEKLSNIAFDSLYYDQPDFNHQIKSRSDLTPKELFQQLAIMDDTLFWKL